MRAFLHINKITTITAKNYAAQAERELAQWAKLAKANVPADALLVEMFCKQIQKSVHFAMPDDAVIFDDYLHGMRGMDFRLPYPLITVEYFATDSGFAKFKTPENFVHAPKRLIVAFDFEAGQYMANHPKFTEGGVIIWAANEMKGRWVPIPMGVAIPRKWDAVDSDSVQFNSPVEYTDLEKRPAIFFAPAPLCPQLVEQTIDFYQDKKTALQHLFHDINGEASAVLSLCEALSCSNVDTEVIEPVDARKNERRIKQGKLPMYETRRLVIKVPNSRKEGDVHVLQGLRQGPREHLRRGHIRKLADGKKVWVQSCVVGSSENGKISKSYAITT